MSRGKSAFTELKTAMLLHVPFFASLLLDMMRIHVGKYPDIFPPGNETAATDGKNIWIDEDFFVSLTLPQRIFVVCHEVGHAMWMHMPRAKGYEDRKSGPDGKPFNPMKWNWAGDYVINDMLKQSQIGEVLSWALLDSAKYPYTMSVDEVYRLMPNDDCEGDGQGNGDGKGSAGQGSPGRNGKTGTVDVHIYEPAKHSEIEMKRAIQSAANAAKAQGNMPAALDRWVGELLKPKVAWEEHLRNLMMKEVGRDSTTWAKFNRRRYVSQGVIWPGYTGFGCGTVAVAVDTSGSISGHEMVRFLSELTKIIDDCKPEVCIIMGCDAKVHDATFLYFGDALQDKKPPLKGGGGTSFRPPFDWLEKENIRPDTMVYFTDMYGDFPDEPDFPVIWCSTTEGKRAPHGKTIEVSIHDDGE